MSGFQQLYYTSCEHGLSGSSGFQFNAVSEQVSAETRHRVEGLAGYEPPRSLLESDAPELLARCPVNLCHTLDRRGGATTLCVRYVGRDSARRFGNYFAHALHSADEGARQSGGPLAIELWDSPVWTTRIADTTEIPELPAPLPRGPLSPRAAHAFLRAHPGAEQLPALLAAVFAALAEDGSVVVIDETTDRIAHWFAAVTCGTRYSAPASASAGRGTRSPRRWSTAPCEDLLRDRHPRLGRVLAQVPQRGCVPQGGRPGHGRRHDRQGDGPDRAS